MSVVSAARFHVPLDTARSRSRDGERHGRDTWELAEGRSLVLSAPAGRYRLVLLRAGVEVERRLVTLVPGEVNELRP